MWHRENTAQSIWPGERPSEALTTAWQVGGGPGSLWKVDSLLSSPAQQPLLGKSSLASVFQEGLRHLNVPSHSQRNTPVPYRWIGAWYSASSGAWQRAEHGSLSRNVLYDECSEHRRALPHSVRGFPRGHKTHRLACIAHCITAEAESGAHFSSDLRLPGGESLQSLRQ